MKFTLRLLLFLLLVLTGIYAATPFWLPYTLAKQLPPGWLLESLESGYPDLTGIDIDSLQVKGGIQAADMTIAVSGLRFNYRALKTSADSVSVDVYLRSPENRVDETLTLDDLSLPVTKLTGKLPELSVNQLDAAIHFVSEPGALATEPIPPLVLNFEAFKLSPRSDNSFQLVSAVRFAEFPRARGQIEINIGTDKHKADLRFQDNTGSSPWLAVQLEQIDQTKKTATRIQAVLDATFANPVMLDSILKRGSAGLLTHIGGRLELQAELAGQNLQTIEFLSLATEKLEVVTNNGVLGLEAKLLASREGDKINIKLPTIAKIHYSDPAGWVDTLLNGAMPGFQRPPRSTIKVYSELESNSSFLIQTGTEPTIGYNGNISLDLYSSGEKLDLRANNLHVEMGGFPNWELVTANGLIAIRWEESTSFSYSSGELELNADQLSVAAEITSGNGKYTSTGSATLIEAQIKTLATSAARVDMSWQDLDLLNLTGKLSTQTQGFSTELDAKTWAGFDFDISYELLGNANVDGSGLLKFVKGLHLPFEFSGNTQAEHWNITLPLTTIEMPQVHNMLEKAHFELPVSTKLTEGYIDLQGDVGVGDGVTARLAVNGYAIGALMLENSVHKASFSFDTTYDNGLSVSGPVAIESIALTAGIEVTGIKTELKLEDSETIGLQYLEAGLFAGQLNLDNLQFSNGMFEDTTVELNHINLDRLLKFADIDGLKGSGLLDFSLPVSHEQAGINISNGTFRSSGPGHLAYSKEGVAGNNIGLQALENFQYQDLSGTIEYQADGTYLIAVHLEGKNPDLYGGHPVVFNLNINGSLPELFEALFITGDFEEAILKEIKNQ